jgi:hypothetical protein
MSFRKKSEVFNPDTDRKFAYNNVIDTNWNYMMFDVRNLLEMMAMTNLKEDKCRLENDQHDKLIN